MCETQQTINVSETLQAMGCLIHVFEKYAGRDGDADTMSKKELKEFFQNEFGGILGKCSDPAELDRIFTDLDTNGDSKVDFEEFGRLTLSVTVMCYQCVKCQK